LHFLNSSIGSSI